MTKRNPFALVRAQRIRARAERVKAELRARHDASRRGYLSDEINPLPAGTKTPEALVQYENYIPIAVRRAALRANFLARGFAKRPHRRNGRRKGPKTDDTDLARHYFRLIQDYQLSPDEAAQELARALHQAEGVKEKSARVRLRKAIGKLG
jgi:hypothetical protein